MRWLALALLACNQGAIPVGTKDLAVNDLAGPSCADTVQCIKVCESLQACKDACKQRVSPAAAPIFAALQNCLSGPCDTAVGGIEPPCTSYNNPGCQTCIQQNCAAQAAQCMAN
jgi:hypothetical protein